MNEPLGRSLDGLTLDGLTLDGLTLDGLTLDGLTLDGLTTAFGNPGGLLPDLPIDAILARIDQAADPGLELRQSVPRLLELLVTNDLMGVDPTVITSRLSAAGWQQWPPNQREAIGRVFDQWWASILATHPHAPSAEISLATLVHLELPLVRWLHPLLEAFDGPGALHVGEIITGQLGGVSWVELDDARGQILAWCRSEPVVLGLTVIAGVHLPPGQLGELLDILL